MGVLAKFPKQPVEVLDYDIDFNPFLAPLGDTLQSITCSIESGATIVSSGFASGVVKVWVGGGADGSQYKVTVVAVTVGGRTKSAEITIKVKEV